MQYRTFRFFNRLLAILLFASCEKVIDIDLNSAAPKIVAEAEMAEHEFCKVKLTRTVNFDEANVFPAVTGAVVRLSDNAGNSETLAETAQGIYSGFTLQGTARKTYTLEIAYDGKSYTAVSTMYPPVAIDTLIVLKGGEGPPMRTGKSVGVQFKDPAGENNYYRFIQLIDTTLQNSIIVDDDALQDGKTITRQLRSRNTEGKGLQPGDSITVRLLTIDKAVFDYFRTLNQTGGSGGLMASSPTNPLTNFSNGALGYFSAYAVQSKSIVIK